MCCRVRGRVIAFRGRASVSYLVPLNRRPTFARICLRRVFGLLLCDTRFVSARFFSSVAVSFALRCCRLYHLPYASLISHSFFLVLNVMVIVSTPLTPRSPLPTWSGSRLPKCLGHPSACGSRCPLVLPLPVVSIFRVACHLCPNGDARICVGRG